MGGSGSSSTAASRSPWNGPSGPANAASSPFTPAPAAPSSSPTFATPAQPSNTGGGGKATGGGGQATAPATPSQPQSQVPYQTPTPTAPSPSFASPTSPPPTGQPAPQPSGQSFGDLQQQAASGYNRLTAAPNTETGLSPYTQGIVNHFQSNVQPVIEAQHALTGTAGSPALTDSLSQAYYSQLPSVLQYQQQGTLGGLQGMTNLAGATSQHGLGLAGLQNQATNNQANFNLGVGQLANQFNQTELQRQQQAFNNTLAAGQVDQSYRQSPLDATYNDMLRRMGFSQFLATGGMQPPMGSTSTTTQRGGK